MFTHIYHLVCSYSLFLFNDTATTEIYTLSLHDALPIYLLVPMVGDGGDEAVDFFVIQEILVAACGGDFLADKEIDRKSTRLNSSHSSISYAVFCLKKKRKKKETTRRI